jgi:hypothetical protein
MNTQNFTYNHSRRNKQYFDIFKISCRLIADEKFESAITFKISKYMTLIIFLSILFH